MTRGLSRAMTDGAQILGRLLAAPPGPAPRPGRADTPAARRWITAALTDRRPAGECALLLVDIDRFHALNEVLGSAAGDEVLVRTAERIEALLGEEAVMLRLDGDRFAIVAERMGTDPRSLADRVLRAVAAPIVIDGRNVAVQASIGIVDRIADPGRASTLLAQATAALRRAKLEGRNRYVLHVPAIDTLDLERSRLEFDLAHALAQGQMQLVFQPYVTLATGAAAGAEALLRWQHPTRGEMRPASFLPLAETTGLILPLGAWTLRRALEAASGWPDRLTLSVNISALQFHQPRFVAEVDAALAASGFPASRLELEITETVLMRDNPQTVGQLRALIARGIRIALDDFGTGYSALAYLARLPHHRIKLDRAFIQDLGNPATAELIRAIVASARAQGIAITAEGAETPAQLEAVRAMGFTHAQGFAIGAPVADPGGLFALTPA
jgi:diguanylate cyclase (GGDEF)-like protein